MWLVIGLGIAAVLIWLIRMLSGVLLPFFVACFVAYILQPLVQFNQRWTHTKGRGLASALTLIEVIAVLAALVLIFLPSVIKDTTLLGQILHEVESGKRPLPEHMVPLVNLVNEYAHPDRIKELLNSFQIPNLLSKGGSLLSQGVSVLMDVLDWLLCLIYIVFILIDYPTIARGLKMIIPLRWRDKGMEVVHDIQTNMDHYFRGQGKVALCACVLYCIGFSIVGFPLAIPMGLIVGILYMIPYFQYVTLIPVAIICFIFSLGGSVEFWPLLGKCLLVYVVSQSVCDYLITPHVMGKEMGMNPAVILLSLSIWGSLLGIIGMIIALPVSAFLMSYYTRYISEPENPVQSDKL